MLQERKCFSLLLVKKHREDLLFLRKSLEENKIFPSRIDLADDLEDAFCKLKSKKNDYQMLLLESEGEDLTRSNLRKLEGKSLSLPFVLLLPIKDEKLVRQARQAGVADIIVKSESQFHELAEKLRDSYKSFQHRKKRPERNKKSEREPAVVPPAETAGELSVRDELTGLYSHGYLYERVVHEFSAAARYGYPISCIMLDIDNLKKINEELGYFTGEKILKEFADLLFENCRMSDFVARFTGKEFCMVLPHSGYEGSKELASRIKKILESHTFKPDGKEVRLTLSVGVSSYPEDEMTQRGDLIRYSTEALFHSKALGRNRVSLFKDIIPDVIDDLPLLQISEEKIAVFQRRMSDINNSFRKAYLDASKAMIMALEAKDRHTVGHSANTAKYSFWMAQAMGMNKDEAETVRLGTLLHDIGKICIPDSILLKPGRLTIAEFEVMKQHAFLGYKMLKPIKFLQQESLIVLHHHEWFNGQGYPDKLKGVEIPLGARIAGVADSFDTMCTAGGRYKKVITAEDACKELIACSGTQFDPDVVRFFVEVLKQHGELAAHLFPPEEIESLQKAAVQPSSQKPA